LALSNDRSRSHINCIISAIKTNKIFRRVEFRGRLFGLFGGGFFGCSGFLGRSRFLGSYGFFGDFGDFGDFGGFGAGGFGGAGNGGFAARGGVFLEQAFFDGFVVLGLDFAGASRGGGFFETFEGGFDVLFDRCVFGGALGGLPSGFFGRFDDWHRIFLI